MSYDWTIYTPDGEIAQTINLGSTSLHALLFAMRAFDLLDEVTPEPSYPLDGTVEDWRAVLEQPSPDPLRIPRFKLVSQQGWRITWQECYLLVHRLGHIQVPRIKRLIDFAREAVSRGGFTVS